VPGISHLKNRAKKLGSDSLDALQGRRHSIVYMDIDGNVLWDEKVNYNNGVLAVPPPMSLEEWQTWCTGRRSQ
jgi:hypothetical protein